MEYAFLAAICAEGWRHDRLVEVAKAATDAHGYDLILSARAVTRYVRLKASVAGGRSARQKVSLDLAKRVGGCVLWLVVDEDDLALRRLGWIGGAPGERLPDLGDRVAKHTKGNAEGAKLPRENHRVLAKGRFDRGDEIGQVFDRLFGAVA
ncbi:hypothetical protein jaqu_10720 [Jannaschia aquimarina]|uniref:Holliday junction resolvase n=2 Tax=Jannaschia aquimarina TaxID=935700 RepID=A0A0D1ENX7_9RHOB|nr:hypothetical protein jaqu_10720 [Jannaschia aquimarina]SNT20567.1 hypothetical protein SAMN05421775_107198 [Jannaschia aquimarina]